MYSGTWSRMLFLLLGSWCCVSYGQHQVLEGVWVKAGRPHIAEDNRSADRVDSIPEFPKTLVAFCGGNAISRWLLTPEIGTDFESRYRVVSGNAISLRLSLSRSGLPDRIIAVRFLSGGISIEQEDCEAASENCRAWGVAFVRRIAELLPEADADDMISNLEVAHAEARYVRAEQSCEEFHDAVEMRRREKSGRWEIQRLLVPDVESVRR